jgi:hypothetical protein
VSLFNQCIGFRDRRTVAERQTSNLEFCCLDLTRLICPRTLFVLLASCLLSACSLFGPEITQVQWERDGALTYHEEATLKVTIAPGSIIHGDPDAMIDASGALAVLHKSREILSNGATRVTFSVVPVKAGRHIEATIRYGRNRNATFPVSFDVDMPSLAGRSNGSFLEMVSAPDSSIYGSHITQWESLDGALYISGHAVSNVCRKVSAAVIDYAVSHSLINDDFFVGAGFASMPNDPDASKAVLAKIRAMGLPPEIDRTLSDIDEAGDAASATELASVVDDPSSYHKPSDESVAFGHALGLDNPDLQSEHDHALDRAVVDAHLPDLVEWVRNPDSAIAHWQGMQGIELSFPVDIIEGMPPDKRARLASYLRQYAESLNGPALFTHEVDDVENSSGLVRQRYSEVPARDVIVTALKSWYVQARPGDESLLGVVAAKDDGDLSMIASGIVFLPFINTETHRELMFEVPKSLFISNEAQAASNGDKPLLDMLGESVTQEIVSSLREAAARQEESRGNAMEMLAKLQSELQAANDKREWLLAEKNFSITEVDARGNVVDTVVKRMNNATLWLQQVRFADDTRQSAQSFRQSAQRIEEQSKDPKAVAINNYTLLDSFLRGWDLSFLDNAKQSPYRRWLESRRSDVWGEIFRQAESQHIDLSGIVSEQTVFQVREEGDNYKIKPMYVGEFDQTSVVKSKDGPLLYYRAPWAQRNIVYLDRNDVNPASWNSASGIFKPDAPNPSLRLLAGPMLDTALEQEDWRKQQEGIFNALVVAPEYTANRLISDYWDQWKVSDEDKTEEQEFETVLVQPNSDDAKALSRSQSFRNYAQVRAFEGGLKILTCMSEAISSLEKDEGKASANIADGCFTQGDIAEKAAFNELGVDDQLNVVRKKLAEQAARWNQDALGRTFAEHDLLDASDEIARLLIEPKGGQDAAESSKRGMEAYIRLLWYSGNYREALDATVAAVLKHAASPTVKERAKVLELAQMELLKALIYSGAKLGSAGAPTFSTASLQRESDVAHATYFEMPRNDFAMTPPRFDRIAYRVGLTQVHYDVPSWSARDSAFVQFQSVSPPTVGEISDNVALGGLDGQRQDQAVATTMRTSGGVHNTIVTRQGKSVRELSYSEVIDDQGNSLVTKIAVSQEFTANQILPLLRSAGFEMLQVKDIPEEFERAVVLAYPDHLVVVTGKQAIDLQVPNGGGKVADQVRTALSRGGISNELIPGDGGLLQEAKYIMAKKVDSASYFSDMQPFPGVLAWSRDAGAMRVLTRQPDDTLASWSLENGQIKQTARGNAALEDLQSFERASLAKRSDERVKFMQVRAFELDGQDSVSVQLGKSETDVPLSEFETLISGESDPTPQLDSLFPAIKDGEPAPTIIIYRGALTNGIARTGGGGGRGKPPGFGTWLSEEPEDPDEYWRKVVQSGGGGGHAGFTKAQMLALMPVDTDRSEILHAYGESTAHVPPVELLGALRDKYPGYRFLLDDNPDVARENALKPILVASTGDVGAYIPEKSFRVTDYNVIKGARSTLQTAGVTVEDSMKKLNQQNIIVLSGHKDQAFVDYVDAHIKQGNLKDKLVVLFSCYQQGDAHLAHRIIDEGGAREVIFFDDTISASGVQAVLKQLAANLQLQHGTENGKPMLEVLDQSMKAAIDDPDTPEAVAREVKTLYDSRVPQISIITPLSPKQNG